MYYKGIIMDLKWKCKDCNCSFKTKAKLYEHRHTEHNIKSIDKSKFCKFCNKHYTETKREHLKICPNRRHAGFKWTEEEKQKLSIARKKYLKEHPDKHIWKRSNKFKSVPCEHLKTILKEKFNFVEEYTDIRWKYNYAIDIAFLDKKLAIEVNGNQHYDAYGKLTDYYQKRHDYLEKFGWIVLEIHYSWCYKEDKIKELFNAIENKNAIDSSEHELLFINRRKTKLERKQEKLKAKIQRKLQSNNLIEERKKLILNTNVDLTKFGWVNKVSKITGLTRRQIARIVKLTELKNFVFIRTLNKVIKISEVSPSLF